MTDIMVKDRVLIDYFPPYGRPEISIEGSIAQLVGLAIAISMLSKTLRR